MALRNKSLALSCAGAALMLAGYAARIVGAQSPMTDPSSSSEAPLYYSGTLEEGGVLVDGMRKVKIDILPSNEKDAAVLCTTPEELQVSVTRGRFRVQLSPTCAAVIRRTPSAWIRIVVDGYPMGVTQIGAVPYALNAVPPYAVMFFNLQQCPAGWSRFNSANGRTIVGIHPGGTLGGQVAVPFADVEARTHTHGMSHVHQIAGRTDDGAWSAHLGGGCCGAGRTGGFLIDTEVNEVGWGLNTYGINFASQPASRINADDAGGESVPYVQLLACQKD